MQVRQLIAAALVSVSAFGAAGAMAQDSVTNAVGTTSYPVQSQRSRESVIAELRSAQASGQWHPTGEVGDTPIAALREQASTVSRSEVKADVAQARANHQLPRVGELM
jgi:hypothetical protein